MNYGYMLTFGFRQGRGGVRITGTHYVMAPDAMVARSKAQRMCARYEEVLFCDRVDYFSEEDKDPLDYESIEVV